jgi:hypothetical protein
MLALPVLSLPASIFPFVFFSTQSVVHALFIALFITLSIAVLLSCVQSFSVTSFSPASVLLLRYLTRLLDFARTLILLLLYPSLLRSSLCGILTPPVLLYNYFILSPVLSSLISYFLLSSMSLYSNFTTLSSMLALSLHCPFLFHSVFLCFSLFSLLSFSIYGPIDYSLDLSTTP